MLLALLLLFSEFLIGYTTVSWARIRATPIERFFYSLVSGFMIGSWILFILQLFVGLNNLSVYLSISVLLITSKKTILKICRLTVMDMAESFRRQKILAVAKNYKITVIFFVSLLILLSFLNYKDNLEPKYGGLYAGRITYADLPLHLSLINSFLENSNKDFEWVDFAYVRMAYNFMPDFGAAALVSGGITIRESLILTGVIFGFAIFVLFYFLARAITGNSSVALLSVILLTFSGGLGFVYISEEWQSVDFNNIKDYSHIPEKNIHIPNFVGEFITATRPMLIGFPAFFIVSTILWKRINRKAHSRELEFAAVVIGMLPLFNIHVFLALGIASFAVFILSMDTDRLISSRRRLTEWLLFLSVILLLALPQATWILSSVAGRLGSQFMALDIGWVFKGGDWPLLWIMNLGMPLVLAPPAFIYARKKLRLFYLPFLFLLIVSALVRFQTNTFDNTLMIYNWLFVDMILVSTFVYKMYTGNFLMKFLSVTLIVLSAVSGFTAILSASQISWRLYSSDDVEMAEWIKANTPADSVFLTGNAHNNFVSSLAGRRILMGGFLWGRISDYSARQADITNMFSGTEQSKELMTKYEVDYIVIGPAERSLSANESFFEKEFELVKDYSSIKLFKAENKRF